MNTDFHVILIADAHIRRYLVNHISQVYAISRIVQENKFVK